MATEIVLAAINAKWIHPSLALRLLKANLGSLESCSEIMEFALRQPLREKLDPILAARPRILALSVSIWNHQATLDLLKALEKEWGQQLPNKPLVVLGGPEVSWLGEEAEIFRCADYVIRGEGEESFRSLCYDLLAGKQQGMHHDKKQGKFRAEKDGAVFINQGNTTVDVNKIASPYSLYTDEDLRRKLVYVEASRGCPFGCEFCQASKKQASKKQASLSKRDQVLRPGAAGSVRDFPLEPFLEDMGRLIDRGARSFKFLDRTFNLDMERVKRICEFFLERIEAAAAEKAGNAAKADNAAPENAAASGSAAVSDKSRPLCVHFEMVPFRFPPELKELLRRFPPGTLRLELGIQTLNPETAALIHLAGEGRQTPDSRSFQGLENLEFLRRETKTIVHVDLIAGLPGEDSASFGRGFDRLWKVLSGSGSQSPSHNGFFEIQLGILKCLPGTAIIRHNETFGMRYDPCPPYEVIETGAIPKTELDRIKNFARFWELMVNRNPFPEMLPDLLPPEEPVFGKFMFLSDRLLEKFGKNWGIDRQDLKICLKELTEEKMRHSCYNTQENQAAR